MTELFKTKGFIACPQELPELTSYLVVDKCGNSKFDVGQLDTGADGYRNYTPVKTFPTLAKAKEYAIKEVADYPNI